MSPVLLRKLILSFLNTFKQSVLEMKNNQSFFVVGTINVVILL